MLGMALVAALVMIAVAAASALAAPPELGRCVKVTSGTGKYKDAGCEKGEVTAKGTYNWEPSVLKPRFKSEEGKSTFETPAKVKITCTSDFDEGEYFPPTYDGEIIEFSGCLLSGAPGTKQKFPCQSARQTAGTIETNTLLSTLGFIKAPNQVGVDLSSSSGGPLVEFECAGLQLWITGSMIAPVTPISKMTTTFKEKFMATHGVQSVQQFEGQEPDTLTIHSNMGFPEPIGFTSTDTVTNEEALEINEVL
jgi:hypothetical protein